MSWLVWESREKGYWVAMINWTGEDLTAWESSNDGIDVVSPRRVGIYIRQSFIWWITAPVHYSCLLICCKVVWAAWQQKTEPEKTRQCEIECINQAILKITLQIEKVRKCKLLNRADWQFLQKWPWRKCMPPPSFSSVWKSRTIYQIPIR